MRPSSSNMDGILLRLLLAFVQDVMNILYSRLQLEVKTTDMWQSTYVRWRDKGISPKMLVREINKLRLLKTTQDSST